MSLVPRMALGKRSGNEGNLSVPVAFNDDGDLTEDLDQLRAGIDESVEVPSADLFVGAVSPFLVAVRAATHLTERRRFRDASASGYVLTWIDVILGMLRPPLVMG